VAPPLVDISTTPPSKPASVENLCQKLSELKADGPDGNKMGAVVRNICSEDTAASGEKNASGALLTDTPDVDQTFTVVEVAVQFGAIAVTGSFICVAGAK
jgi:hypothetical protein